MKEPLRKVIKASAGTGKTYRLSLEFIYLLLEYRSSGISFEEILVITFTRKATSEIRAAIYEHINDLLTGTKKGDDLKKSLIDIFGRKIEESDLTYLQEIYNRMLTNKHKLQISTIDSFVHSIFKSIIAPYIGITDFRIDNEINKRYLPNIYNHIFHNRDDSAAFIEIFRTAGKKTLEQYDRFILSIIDNRWLFQMMGDKLPETFEGEAEKHLQRFRTKFNIIIDRVGERFQTRGVTGSDLSSLVKKDFVKLTKAETFPDFVSDLRQLIDNEQFLASKWSDLTSDLQFWKVNPLGDKDLKEDLKNAEEEARQELSLYIFHKYLLPEEGEIVKLAEHILQEYDRLKLRDRIFTYNDIAFYTYKYMYDEALSLIDPDTGGVYNRFYEYLTARTRFMLIDEFQDTGIIQHKLLFPIISEIISGAGSKEYGGVIVVGDEKQSIYGWRDGERDLLLNMPSILQQAEELSLDTTFRSTEFLTGFINKFFTTLSQNLHHNALDWQYREIDSFSKSQVGFLGFYFLNKSKSVKVNEEGEAPDTHRIFVEEAILPFRERGEFDPAGSVILARNNKDLETIAGILEDNGIEYFLESSFSFLQHKAIKPLIYLLRYISGEHILYLLRFFRSDYCLLSPAELKKVCRLHNEAKAQKKNLSAILKDHFPENHSVGKTIRILEKGKDICSIIADTLREFNVTTLFPEEHNIKNLHLFVETVSKFFSEQSLEYEKNLQGLFAYLTDNEKNEDFRQANIENIDSLQLMTIHKSKGLQFDHVFFYYDISSGGGNRSGNLEYLYRFNPQYSELQEKRISYNYSGLLKEMSYPLKRQHEIRDLLEEINNIYVVLTRARKNLSIFTVFQSADGVTKAVEQKRNSDLPEVRKLYLQTLINYLDEVGEGFPHTGEDMAVFIRREYGTISSQPGEVESPVKDNIDYGRYVNLNREELRKEPVDKVDLYLNLRTVYLEKRQVLTGDIVHYYLSYIFYNEEVEKNYASMRTLNKYGNLLDEDAIRKIIEGVNKRIAELPQLFERGWSRVFNEKSIFDDYGKGYRIDRMLVDEEIKEILLVDYKTGSVKDAEQLHKYKEIVEKIPFVMAEGYFVDVKYIEIVI